MAERKEATIPGSLDRANSASVAVGATTGAADTTGDTVKRKSGAVTCPNCDATFDTRDSMKGDTIPCLCGFLLNVA